MDKNKQAVIDALKQKQGQSARHLTLSTLLKSTTLQRTLTALLDEGRVRRRRVNGRYYYFTETR